MQQGKWENDKWVSSRDCVCPREQETSILICRMIFPRHYLTCIICVFYSFYAVFAICELYTLLSLIFSYTNNTYCKVCLSKTSQLSRRHTWTLYNTLLSIRRFLSLSTNHWYSSRQSRKQRSLQNWELQEKNITQLGSKGLRIFVNKMCPYNHC